MTNVYPVYATEHYHRATYFFYYSDTFHVHVYQWILWLNQNISKFGEKTWNIHTISLSYHRYSFVLHSWTITWKRLYLKRITKRTSIISSKTNEVHYVSSFCQSLNQTLIFTYIYIYTFEASRLKYWKNIKRNIFHFI